jgi:hypothetical protein
MLRRTFLATLPGLAAAGGALAQSREANPNRNRPDVGPGDRIDGATFASRSAAWGVRGAAATAHPLATQTAIDILRKGGSAVDAAIAANAVLGLVEPIACGIGGDAFAMLWDPRTRRVEGLNGSGRSPKGLSLQTVRARAVKGLIPSFGAISVSVPGAVDAWWTLHQRYGKLPWKDLLAPAAALAREGVPVSQNVAEGRRLVEVAQRRTRHGVGHVLVPAGRRELGAGGQPVAQACSPFARCGRAKSTSCELVEGRKVGRRMAGSHVVTPCWPAHAAPSLCKSIAYCPCKATPPR